VFGGLCLRDLTPATVQTYFSGLHARSIPYPTLVKTRDALSSILRAAVKFKFLDENPIEGLELPPDTRGSFDKPWIKAADFYALLDLIPEPYSTIVYVAVRTGLRPSELSGLRRRNVTPESIKVEQRFHRGNWSCPKTKSSGKRIWIEPDVFERLERLNNLTVDVRAGCAVRHHHVVKTAGLDALVFQSVQDGKPINTDNILKRFIKPAARQLGLNGIHWRSLRTSCATWMLEAGADPKSVSGQMRHSRIETTLNVYAQFVPEGQKRAVRQQREYMERELQNSGPQAGPLTVQ
jgi:integrase